MQVKKLVELWEENAAEARTTETYTVHLPVHDAAKLAALNEMFPGRSEQDLITDLLSAALNDLEASFPYIEGKRVIAEDEQGDPIYEDVGSTPTFAELTRKHLNRIKREMQES